MVEQVQGQPEIAKLSDIRATLIDDKSLSKLLTSTPKKLPNTLSYTEEGSQYFAELCHQPEYYPAHVERNLLKAQGQNIIDFVRPIQIVDLGCGSMEKTQILLHEAIKKHNRVNFVPCDIDPHIIQTGISKLTYFYGHDLEIHPVQGLFQECISWCPKVDGSTLFTFMGLTYGNMTSEERDSFLRFLRTSMNDQDYFLISVDLVKDRTTMENAYQDKNGLVSKSMLESLNVLNNFYNANFLLDQFYHLAQYESERRCIVEYLISRCDQHVYIPGLDLSIEIKEQEPIEAEFSEKFVFEELISDLSRCGFCPAQTYTDIQMQYAMILLHRGRQVDAQALRNAA